MNGVILDASALIAVITQEKGADKVSAHLSEAIISTVNLTEVASYLIRKGATIKEVRYLLADLSIEVAAYDEAQAFLAAELLPRTSTLGLSLGDRACLALAMTRTLPVFTTDKAWSSLDVGITITLMR